MSKKNINVIGIMIDTEYKNFKLYHKNESWEKSTQNGTHTSYSTSGDSWVEGLSDILRYLSIPLNANTQFVIVYDVSCPNKEKHIKKLLAGINKIKNNDLLPTLISIGHEQSPWNEDITGQVSIIKEVENTGARNNLFKNTIGQELSNIKKELIAADKAAELLKNSAIKSSQMQEENTSSISNVSVSMMVLGGFIATAGIAAVAIAFTVLNAATFGVAGLVVAGIGVAAALSGVGLFARGAYKNKNINPDISLDHSNNIVPI